MDFSKAFDLIDHNILLNKFVSNGVPEHVTVWSLDFLNDHKQLVKSVSSTTVISAGTPQGTVSGPNDFKLVINECHGTLMLHFVCLPYYNSFYSRICVPCLASWGLITKKS